MVIGSKYKVINQLIDKKERESFEKLDNEYGLIRVYRSAIDMMFTEVKGPVISPRYEIKNGHLIWLTLSYIRNIKFELLEGLIYLQGLSVDDCGLKDMKSLNNLENVKSIFIDHNRIEKIEGLDNLKNLDGINLSHNCIQKIEGLEHLTQLKYLHLDYNKIEKIEGLEELVNLEVLNLNFNQIRELEGLENLSKLKELHISINPLIKEDRQFKEKDIKAIIEYCKEKKKKLN